MVHCGGEDSLGKDPEEYNFKYEGLLGLKHESHADM